MVAIVGSIITSLIVSVFVFPVLIKYSIKQRILSLPGHRRIHTRVTPSIGGVAIFIGFITTSIVWLDVVSTAHLRIILAILFITFLLGLCDDLVHVKPSVKILGQAVGGSLAYFLIDIKITSVYNWFPFSGFEWVSLPVTIFVIIIITNSYNLIDGIDGLAGSFASAVFLFFGVWFFLAGDQDYSILCFAFLGACLGFLVFNWEPAKIFMGDTGALLIGMAISLITIRFMQIQHELPTDSVVKFNPLISTSICILIIPILDTTRVIVIRISKGISPLTADKRHIHHSLVRLGLSHQQSVLTLLAVHLLFITTAFVLKEQSDLYLGTFIIITLLLLNVLLNFCLKRKVQSS